MDAGSGFWNVTTPRSFELAILDGDATGPLSAETGGGDDFRGGKVGATRAGSPVVPGEFVFLSMMGGLEGADVDTLAFETGPTQWAYGALVRCTTNSKDRSPALQLPEARV